MKQAIQQYPLYISPEKERLPLRPNDITEHFVASRKKYLWKKRAFDISFSVLIIIGVMSWLLPVLAVLIKTSSRGPVFFRQRRVGKNGRFFTCLKLRTMRMNAEADHLPAQDNDERITTTGRILRRCYLDELPQFFNVLAGDMSIVGPRPHMLADCRRFSFVIPDYAFRHLLKPGITGWAQVNGWHGPTKDYESIALRYYWDAQYIRKAGLLLDLKIIAATLQKAVRSVKPGN